jgi:hypothetical protein
LREDHIIDPRWIDAGPLDQRLEDDGAQITGGKAGKSAAELADRRPQRGDDGTLGCCAASPSP